MTTTNPNPLDRIRALAPADMTDDELGVAVLWSAGHEPQPEGGAPKHRIWKDGRGYVCVYHGPPIIVDWYRPNPALDLDALFEIVRKWMGSDEQRCNLLRRGILRILDATRTPNPMRYWLNDRDKAAGFMALLFATPRQLAEAFVTAAREVSKC